MFNHLKSRRGFIKTLFKSVASLFAFGPFARIIEAKILTEAPRVRIPNPFVTDDGRPILVCVEGTDYELMLNAGLHAMGGLDLLIDDNQDVLLKPNLVYTEEYPTTSDINSMVSTIGAIQANTTGVITVADSGGIDVQEIYDYFNLEPIITQAGGNLIIFSGTTLVRRSSWEPEIPDFEIFSDVYNTPVMINLCSLKRHYKAFLTCAIKHHVGAVSGPNRVDTRGYIHTFPDLSNEFLQMLAELAGLINPELTIVDARLIMAINGPLLLYGGEIRPVNKVVICGDMVAADAYCAQLMQENDETFDAATVTPMLDRAELLGLGTADLSQVEIIEFETTSVDDYNHNLTPNRFALAQNYPNPFNAVTNISFSLPSSSNVRLQVFDMLGRQAAVITDKAYSAGVHTLNFDAGRLPSGTYYYYLTTPNYRKSKAMVLVK